VLGIDSSEDREESKRLSPLLVHEWSIIILAIAREIGCDARDVIVLTWGVSEWLCAHTAANRCPKAF
jgi:hypothetical protein